MMKQQMVPEHASSASRAIVSGAIRVMELCYLVGLHASASFSQCGECGQCLQHEIRISHLSSCISTAGDILTTALREKDLLPHRARREALVDGFQRHHAQPSPLCDAPSPLHTQSIKHAVESIDLWTKGRDDA